MSLLLRCTLQPPLLSSAMGRYVIRSHGIVSAVSKVPRSRGIPWDRQGKKARFNFFFSLNFIRISACILFSWIGDDFVCKRTCKRQKVHRTLFLNECIRQARHSLCTKCINLKCVHLYVCSSKPKYQRFVLTQ